MLRDLFQRLLPHRSVQYDDQFFKESWFTEWSQLRHVLQQLVQDIHPNQRIIDFGCGPGVMIDHMGDAGFYYIGCDYSIEAHKLYTTTFGRYPERYANNLDVVARQDFDMVLSFDVLEHMTDEQIETVIRLLDRVPLWFVNISRDRRTPGHINIKNDKKWVEFFQKNGLAYDKPLTEHLREHYAQLRQGTPDRWDKNMFIFKNLEFA